MTCVRSRAGQQAQTRGQPIGRLDVVANAQVARLSAEQFNVERAQLVKACSQRY
ncbi:MAG: hypothetical protein GWP58_11710 [Gammaproteobacteria bacterium]|nr:hypothetical protein [Gammaproteobacteria bacterium]